MMGLIVRGISYQSLNSDFSSQEKKIEKDFSRVLEQLTRNVDLLLEKTNVSPQNINRHFLCSTMIELPFSSGDINWPSIAKTLLSLGRHQPQSFINAYECASWGYALRYCLNQSKNKYLLVSILDANFYEFEFWKFNQHWEKSGFGITSVLLEVTETITDELVISATTTSNSMAEFATQVRRLAARKEDVTLAMPFFPKEIQQMFNKLLNGQARLPDLHTEWGHCFGSDPWLSMLCHSLQEKVKTSKRIMACSYALNGYYSLADVLLTPETKFILNQEVAHV